MNPDPTSLEGRLLALLQAARDAHDAAARTALNELLRREPAARAAMARLMVDEQALLDRLRDDGIVSLLDSAPAPATMTAARPARWLAWRPVTAAAAGIVLGMFCTSIVYGLVAQRATVAKKLPLMVYDPGLENAESIAARGVPRAVGQWGADSARLVTAENGVQPLQGRRMLRLEPIPRDKNVRNYASRVYQVLDIASLPPPTSAETAEVQVTASFQAANAGAASRYLIRAFALSETPEQATRGFWPKTQDDGVVSVAQRFDTAPGAGGWHTFSLKMPLPRGARSLVFILGAEPPDDASAEASPHYLDDVRVSVLIP